MSYSLHGRVSALQFRFLIHTYVMLQKMFSIKPCITGGRYKREAEFNHTISKRNTNDFACGNSPALDTRQCPQRVNTKARMRVMECPCCLVYVKDYLYLYLSWIFLASTNERKHLWRPRMSLWLNTINFYLWRIFWGFNYQYKQLDETSVINFTYESHIRLTRPMEVKWSVMHCRLRVIYYSQVSSRELLYFGLFHEIWILHYTISFFFILWGI